MQNNVQQPRSIEKHGVQATESQATKQIDRGRHIAVLIVSAVAIWMGFIIFVSATGRITETYELIGYGLVSLIVSTLIITPFVIVLKAQENASSPSKPRDEVKMRTTW